MTSIRRPFPPRLAAVLLAALVACLLAVGTAGAASGACVTTTFKKEPSCRVAVNGATERSNSYLTAYSLFIPDWALNVNPQTHARRWPLRNSLGQPFAWIEQTWDPSLPGFNKTSAWKVYKADGTTLLDQRTFPTRRLRDDPTTPYLAIQGYACMLNRTYAKDPMVVLLHGAFGQAGHYIGVRGFIDPAALPQAPGAILNTNIPEYSRRTARGAPTRGKTVAQVLTAEHANTGCNQAAIGLPDSRPASTGAFTQTIVGNLLDPQFAWFYKYNGKFPLHLNAARPEPYGKSVRRILTNAFDNRYANYAAWPLPPVDAAGGPPATLSARLSEDRSDAQARLEADTTGIGTGGIVRAIIPLGTQYVVKDWFGYVDPNGYCGRETNAKFAAPAKVAQWVLVSIPGTPLEGWVPRKLPFPKYDSTGCGQ